MYRESYQIVFNERRTQDINWFDVDDDLLFSLNLTTLIVWALRAFAVVSDQ